MEQYIPKSALLAEIDKKIEFLAPYLGACAGQVAAEASNKIAAYGSVKEIINSLEVKEVDEVKIGETKIYLEDDGGEPPYDGNQWLDLSCTEYAIPKALFKDGDNVEILIRKAQKGE